MIDGLAGDSQEVRIVSDKNAALGAYEFKLLIIACRAQSHLNRGRDINAAPPERGGDNRVDVFVQMKPMRSATGQSLKLFLQRRRIVLPEGFRKGAVLLNALINLAPVVVVISHPGMNGGEWQVVCRRDLFERLPHPQMHDHEIGNADAGSGKRWRPAFYARVADDILINACWGRIFRRALPRVILINRLHKRSFASGWT